VRGVEVFVEHVGELAVVAGFGDVFLRRRNVMKRVVCQVFAP